MGVFTLTIKKSIIIIIITALLHTGMCPGAHCQTRKCNSQVGQNSRMFHVSLFLWQPGNKTQIYFIHPAGEEAQTLVRGLLLFLAVTQRKL